MAAVRILGPVEVSGPAGPAVFQGGLQRALVGVLSFNAGITVTSSRLMDALWGPTPPRTAAKTLHGHVARLRRALTACGLPDLLVTSGSGYLLAASRHDVDSLYFEDMVAAARVDLADNRLTRAVEQLRESLASWRGDPVQDGGLFDWGEAEATRLRELYLTAVEDLCEAELRLGRHRVVVAEAERVLVRHPLREHLVELLMQALYRSGRPADALEAYQQLRIRLDDQLGVDPGVDLQGLYTAVLRQDPALRAEGASAPPGPRPAQLPPRVGHFTGRKDELRALDEALSHPSDTRVVVVSGAGGMGKTSVVVQWAHTVRDQFPDGQLFFDLRGHEQYSAMSAKDVLIHSLRALGVPEERLPIERSEQVSQLRSLLDGRRVLIVLDNAAAGDQILPMVPPSPTSMLAVTSRRAMTALTTHHHVHYIQLSAMTQWDSLALLRGVVGARRIDREPAEAAIIVGRCAGLPLALRIAAARLIHQPDLSLRVLADELSTTESLDSLRIEDDSRTVRAVIASSYRTLSPDAALLFRRLGVLPSLSFSRHLAAALSGFAQGQAERALADLADVHLIAEAPGRRYRYHDLIGVYAAERARIDDDPATRTETVTRLLDWYLGVADAANRDRPSTYDRVSPVLAYPPAELPFAAEHLDAFKYLDDERANLVPVVRLAVAEGRETAAWHLVYLLGGFFSTRGRWTDRIELCRLGLTAARRLGDALAEALMGSALGLAYIRMLRFTEALDHLSPALERAIAAGDDVGAARIRNNIGTAYARLRRYDEAVGVYQQALVEEQGSGDRIGVAVALYNIGLSQVHQGRPELGIGHLTEAVRLAREVGNQRMEATMLLGLGEASLQQGARDAALDYYRQALKLQHAVDDRHRKVESLVGIGTVQLGAGEYSEALDHFNEGLRLSQELGDQHLTSVCLKASAEAHLRRDELDAAGQCLRQALTVRTSTPDAYEEAGIYRALAELARRSGEEPVAEEHRQRAIWLYQKANAGAEAEELRTTPA